MSFTRTLPHHPPARSPKTRHRSMQKEQQENGLSAMYRQFAKAVGELWRTIFDAYRPELHYMRGPGPKWHAKH